MAVRPELVKLDRSRRLAAPADSQRAADADHLCLLRDECGPTHRALPYGVWGDPAGSRGGAGGVVLQQITTVVSNLIDDVDNAFAQMTIEQPG